MGVVQLLVLEGWVAKFSKISGSKPPPSAPQDFEIFNFGPPYDGAIESEGSVLADIVDSVHGAVVTEIDEEVAKLENAMFVLESVQ